jgi:hypothetical protein
MSIKQDRIDRLAKAREERLKNNPPAYKEFCQYVVNLPEEHEFSFKKVRGWIKEAKGHKAAAMQAYRADSKLRAKYEEWNSYVSQLESYLRTGGYSSMFAGGNMEKKVKNECIAMAYYPNGKPKRQIGVWYRDCYAEWTPEMENDEREAYDMPRQEYSDKGYVIVDGSTTSTSTPTKKKRKPMGLLQKQAFVERMKKAREAKLTK